jgi:hypothetical protein
VTFVRDNATSSFNIRLAREDGSENYPELRGKTRLDDGA